MGDGEGGKEGEEKGGREGKKRGDFEEEEEGEGGGGGGGSLAGQTPLSQRKSLASCFSNTGFWTLKFNIVGLVSPC